MLQEIRVAWMPKKLKSNDIKKHSLSQSAIHEDDDARPDDHGAGLACHNAAIANIHAVTLKDIFGKLARLE